jgi:hypothetical protein
MRHHAGHRLWLGVAGSDPWSFYVASTQFRSTIPQWRSILRLKHGIAEADIQHAVEHAMTIDNQDDDARLYLGPARSAALLEVVTIVRDDGSEIAIHAMNMRAKYRLLLPGG